MKKIILITIFVLGISIVSILTPQKIFASKIEDLADIKVEGDFTVGPGKTEVFMDPGEKTTRELMITNRTGKATDFKITLEDFKGSETGDTPLILLGSEKGPYSLKDYLKPEITDFTLAHGQRITIPVEISIPLDAEPGGLYGAALISALPPALNPEEPSGQIRVVSRVGSLFFVRVKGYVVENGFLKTFRTADKGKIYARGPFSFEIISQNDGPVHLDPYGIIEIKNILGRKIGEIELDPWFVMPGSIRSRIVGFGKIWLFGHYTAVAKVNRGYGDIVDEKSYGFWVLPWQVIVPILLAIIILAFFFRWFFGKFQLKTKGTV